jgi:type IV pilus assembly protein PilV
MKLSHQRGVGLIEVMVALLVLSISLLAIASLQTRSLQYNQSAYWRSQANIFAYDIIDRIRLNRVQLTDYDLDFGDEGAGAGQAATDMADWLESIEEVLPGGEGAIECAAAEPAANPASNVPATCTVSVRWVETNIFGEVEEGELDAEARTTFTYVTGI